MSFTESIKTCLSKYIQFSGRASRPEYWWFVLFALLVSAVFGALDNALFDAGPANGGSNGPLQSLFSLAIFLPMLAAGWRRMHDTGKPGWYLLLPTLVTIGSFLFLMVGVMGFAGMQNLGADPDALVGPAAFLGVTGMFTVVVVQLALLVLLLWWLTRPSDAGSNDYGPPPEMAG